MALVVKAWAARYGPVDKAGNWVVIRCRRPGIFSWLCSWIGIDPTTSLTCSPDRIEHSTASWSGSARTLIPLSSVCSSRYGYKRPLKSAVALLFSGLVVARYASTIPRLWAAIPGVRDIGDPLKASILVFLILSGVWCVCVLAYYLLNRSVLLMFVEQSGDRDAQIEFTPSVIENKKLSAAEARHVCEIVQSLIEAKLKGLSGGHDDRAVEPDVGDAIEQAFKT
jgi:hypothetical protein